MLMEDISGCLGDLKSTMLSLIMQPKCIEHLREMQMELFKEIGFRQVSEHPHGVIQQVGGIQPIGPQIILDEV